MEWFSLLPYASYPDSLIIYFALNVNSNFSNNLLPMYSCRIYYCVPNLLHSTFHSNPPHQLKSIVHWRLKKLNRTCNPTWLQAWFRIRLSSILQSLLPCHELFETVAILHSDRCFIRLYICFVWRSNRLSTHFHHVLSQFFRFC